MQDELSLKILHTPIGNMQAIASQNGLCALEFVKEDRQRLLDSRISRWFNVKAFSLSQNIYIDMAEEWVSSYFDGRPLDPLLLQKDLRGTAFELRVWTELLNIPYGTTISYAELARRVGIPHAPRAAGGASRRNPMSILVPCHRVIGSTGKLTGYGGGIEQKQFLINHEASINHRIISTSRTELPEISIYTAR